MSKIIAYSYDGVHLPLLPSYDKTIYPYLYLQNYNKAYALSSPLTDLKWNMSGRKATPALPFLHCELVTDENSGGEYWTEWVEGVEGETITINTSYRGWADHDLLDTDSTAYVSAGSKPTPVYLPELLFEGEVTSSTDGGIVAVEFTNWFAIGDTVSVTINGTTEEHIAKRRTTATGRVEPCIGNESLFNSTYEDDGSDFHLYPTGRDKGIYKAVFIPRTAGTYSLRVERIATVGGEDEPETPDPLPVSPYLPINGAWVKHDVYKQVGNTWVKQPQDGYETQQGAWQAIFEKPEPEPEPEPEPNPLPPIGTSLEDCTWEQISAISAAGKAAEYFSVGDTKSVYLKGTVGTLELDTTLYVYILGFDHNSEVEGKGITFGTFKTADGVDVALIDGKYASTNTSGTKYFNMNHWGNYKYGGWAGCDMRYDILGSTDKAPSGYGAAKITSVVGYDPSDTCATSPVANTLMAALPSELRAVMKPMTKYTDGKGGTSSVAANVVATIDYLPLLAEFEIFGNNSYANLYEQNKQKQYDYFVAGNSKLKYRHSAIGSAAWWWERSAFYSNGHSFCFVNSVGDASHYSVYRVGGIAPIFLV